MSNFRCNIVKPYEKIVMPIEYRGIVRFVVRDEEIEERVEEIYQNYVVGTESTVLINCRDENNHCFATIIIEEDGSRWVHFDDPDNRFIPCSRDQFVALVGCSTWCRMWIRMVFDKQKKLVERDMYADVIGEYYFDSYQDWGRI